MFETGKRYYETGMNMSIVFRRVSFKYPTSKPVLQELSFSIAHGQYVAVIGNNGGGKTTLGRLINASLIPSTGSVLIEGLDTRDEAIHLQIKHLVTNIGSDPENQLVTSSVYDEVAFALQASHYPSQEIRARTDEAINLFNLGDFVDRHPFHLSMGQRYKVLLAAAIAREPQYIILDEVLSMLDSHMRDALLRQLLELQKNKGIGLIMITHRLEDLLSADKVIVLSGGVILFEGNVDSLFSQDDSFEQWGVKNPLLFDVLNRLSPESRKMISESYPLPRH